MSLERQQEVAEHDLVIKTLEPLEAERKCFRLVRHAALSVALLLSAADRSDVAWNGAVHTEGRHASCSRKASLCCVTPPSRSSSSKRVPLDACRWARCWWSALWARCCRR